MNAGRDDMDDDMDDDWSLETDFEDWEDQEERGDRSALSVAGIAEQNAAMLRRYRNFRGAADAIVDAWRAHGEVAAVALIGSVARGPWKQIPSFQPFRRARVKIWHECGDLDLALWLDHLGDLDGLRRTKDRVLRAMTTPQSGGVASHQVDIFILEPGGDGYLGRLCDFNRCPRGKRECDVVGCGATSFLRQHDAFEWWPKTLSPERAVRLYDRATGLARRACDLPLPSE